MTSSAFYAALYCSGVFLTCICQQRYRLTSTACRFCTMPDKVHALLMSVMLQLASHSILYCVSCGVASSCCHTRATEQLRHTEQCNTAAAAHQACTNNLIIITIIMIAIMILLIKIIIIMVTIVVTTITITIIKIQ